MGQCFFVLQMVSWWINIFAHMVKWWNHYGVMVKWWNCPMANRFLGTHFHQWWNGEKLKCNLRVGVNFLLEWILFPGTIFLGENCCWRKFRRTGKTTGEIYQGTILGVFVPWDNYWQHLTHYWDANFPGRCLGISCYFCTYYGTYLISSYTKVCVRYVMFLYIHLQCIHGVYPKISQVTLALRVTSHGKAYLSTGTFLILLYRVKNIKRSDLSRNNKNDTKSPWKHTFKIFSQDLTLLIDSDVRTWSPKFSWYSLSPL